MTNRLKHKILTFFAASFWSAVSFCLIQSAQALETTAPFALIMHTDTGRVLFEKQGREPFPPASMSKIVTAGVVMEMLDAGKLAPQTRFRISENAWRTGGAPAGNSTMFAELNSDVAVIDLLRGLIIQSGNDAAIALAEGVAGSESAFTALMQDYVERVGGKSSSFGNASGLPNDRQKMSAYDLAVVARDIQLNHPNYMPIFAEPDFTWNGIFQKNRNPLLGEVEGVTGMKTGYTDDSGYGLVATATRGSMRFIIVVGGLADIEERKEEAEKLVNWAFDSFISRTLMEKGSIAGQARIMDGSQRFVDLEVQTDIAPVMSITNTEKIWGRVFYQGPLKAPIEKGAQVGTLHVYAGNEKLEETPLFASHSVEKGDLVARAKSGFLELFYMALPRFDAVTEPDLSGGKSQ